MVKNHLMRIAAPRSWNIERKKTKFVSRPRPGAHSLQNCMSLNLVLKEILRVVQTTKETKYLVHEKRVLINGAPVHDIRQGLGFMDVLTLLDAGQHYRVSLNHRGELAMVLVTDHTMRIARIVAKGTVKKSVQRITLHDGSTVNYDGNCARGDGVLLDEKGALKQVLPLQEGASVLLTGGSHIGSIGTVQSFATRGYEHLITVRAGARTFTTKKEFAFVVGKDTPSICVGENTVK